MVAPCRFWCCKARSEYQERRTPKAAIGEGVRD